MALTEEQAQKVMLVRSLEQAWDNEGIWSASDAKEATRVTTDLLGAKTAFDSFLARRAEWIVDQLVKRKSVRAIQLGRRPWLAMAGTLLVAAAQAVGFLADHLVSERRVNVIEYPIVGLILWNLLVFALILASAVGGLMRTKPGAGALLSDPLSRWQLAGAVKGAKGNKGDWVHSFVDDWCQVCRSLNGHRIALVFHAASMAFALGALGSLYVRGFFKEYRAVWESTFFSAKMIHDMAGVVLAPGSWLLGIPIPDVNHIAGLQLSVGTGENAANWIHLYAGSMLLWIIVPRLLLLSFAAGSKRRLQRRFPLPISNIYYTALRAVRDGYRAAVITVPFRYALTPQVKTEITQLLERAHGLAATVALEQVVVSGFDADDWKQALRGEGFIAVFVLFNLAATAEADAHGRVLKSIAKDIKGRAPVIPIVDTSAYTERDPQRLAQRRQQWLAVMDSVGFQPLFLDFQTLGEEAAQKVVQSKLYEYA